MYRWYRRFAQRLLFKVILDVALMLDRRSQNRQEYPSAAVMHSRTIKAPGGITRAMMCKMKSLDRKRNFVVDSDGRLLMVNLTAAYLAASTGAECVLVALKKRRTWVTHLFADAALDRLQLHAESPMLQFVVRWFASRRTSTHSLR